jgi:peptidoglycan hydrolase CwlO-like protein
LERALFNCFSFSLKDLRGVISSLEVFASRFTSLEADKVRLQEEVESSSSKLDGAVKIAAAARQEIDSLKEELAKLKGKLKEEEASRLVAEARAAEKDEVLRQSSLALLGNL